MMFVGITSALPTHRRYRTVYKNLQLSKDNQRYSFHTLIQASYAFESTCSSGDSDSGSCIICHCRRYMRIRYKPKFVRRNLSYLLLVYISAWQGCLNEWSWTEPCGPLPRTDLRLVTSTVFNVSNPVTCDGRICGQVSYDNATRPDHSTYNYYPVSIHAYLQQQYIELVVCQWYIGY